MALTRVAPAGIGSTPGTGYVIGDSFLHSRGLNATDGYYTGIVTTQSLRVIGDLEVEGTTTTLDTALTEVDKLEVGANNNTVGVAITQSGTGDILNLYDGSTQVVTVKDGGRVGIGTDNPQRKLSIKDSGNTFISIENSTNVTSGLIGANSSGLTLISRDTQGGSTEKPIQFITGSTEKVRITSAGNVGIRTSAPNGDFTVLTHNNGYFTVSGSGGNGAELRFFKKSDKSQTYAIQNNGGANELVQHILAHSSGQYKWSIGGTERLRITSAGTLKVGSNTLITPDANADNLVIDTGDVDSGLSILSATTGRIYFGDAADDEAGSIRYVHTDNSMRFETNSTERLRITSTGTLDFKTADGVGINFRESGYINIDSDNDDSNRNFSFYDAKGTGSEKHLMIITDTGLVGIGTNTVTRGPLHIHQPSTSDCQIHLTNNNTGTTSSDGLTIFTGQSNGDCGFVSRESGGSIEFYTNNSGSVAQRLRITSDGTLNLFNGTINLGTADSSSGHINAYEVMTFNIDSDNDDTNRHFTWYKNGESGSGTGMMRLDENGRLVIGGDLATSGNNLTLKNSSAVEIDMNCTGGSGNNFRLKSDSGGIFTIRDHSAGADRLTIRDNGNIGIGDNDPSQKLNVAGNIMLEGGDQFMYLSNAGTGNSGIYVRGNTSGSYLRSHSTGMFTWEVTGSEKMRIDSQGRLGVGVTPKGFHANNKDVIQGSSGYVILGRGTSSLNISQNFYYDFSDAGKYIATGAATLYNQSNGSHTFYNASSGSADASASLVERFQIQSDGRVSIGAPAANALGALHIHANQGTDTALWIGDSSTNRYLAINEQGSSQNFNHINTRYNDNAIHAHYILDNPYAQGTGYGSQILFRGNNQGTTAYIETSNEASGSARGTLRLRGADNHGLDVRSTGEVTTTHASNIGYATNAATNTRSLVYQSRDPQRQEPAASEWYILKTFYPNKSGTVNMHAEMYIASGSYYFSFRVREEGTDTIVFNAGDNGGYGAYATNGNAVHSYKIYKWICPLIKAHKRYYIEMAATNAAGTAGPYTSVGQWLYLKNFSVYSMSGGHSDGTEAMQIGQSQDVSSATANSGTTHFYMSPGVNRDSINVTQYFAGTESTFLGWFTTRAYNRYLDFELNLSGSYMWFAQAYGYLYSRGQVAGSMISGYTYTGNTILNKYSHTFGNRGWYGSYRTSGGNLCLKFDSGGNGYSEGRIALFLGTHGPTNPDWRVLQYRQNDTTNNIF